MCTYSSEWSISYKLSRKYISFGVRKQLIQSFLFVARGWVICFIWAFVNGHQIHRFISVLYPSLNIAYCYKQYFHCVLVNQGNIVPYFSQYGTVVFHAVFVLLINNGCYFNAIRNPPICWTWLFLQNRRYNSI